jgi:hypothetical protein
VKLSFKEGWDNTMSIVVEVGEEVDEEEGVVKHICIHPY